MKKRGTRYKKSNFVKLFCGILFALFSFSFLYFMQGDLLAEAQYVYSEGITTYSILPGALIITFILLLIQWVTGLMLPFKDSYYAISYVPSCILLAIATNIDEKMLANSSFGNLVWILPILLCVYIFIVHLLYKVCSLENVNHKSITNRPVWINSLVLLVLFVFVGAYSNTNDILAYELKTERLIYEGEYDEAARVGGKSLRSSRRLTELRMFALANTGRLGERMFNYPQYYGAEGLLDISDTLPNIYRVSSSDVCNAIGIYPEDNITTREYLEKAFNYIDSLSLSIYQNEEMLYESIKVDEMDASADAADTINVQMLKDYYYAYLLLNKDVNEFCSIIDVSEIEYLPKAYSEAVMLAYESNMSEMSLYNNSERLQRLYSHIDTITIRQRAEYKEMYNSISDEVERMNRLRRNYGNTYWWYYEYSDSVVNPTY